MYTALSVQIQTDNNKCNIYPLFYALLQPTTLVWHKAKVQPCKPPTNTWFPHVTKHGEGIKKRRTTCSHKSLPLLTKYFPQHPVTRQFVAVQKLRATVYYSNSLDPSCPRFMAHPMIPRTNRHEKNHSHDSSYSASIHT